MERGFQFWDASALVAAVLKENNTPTAIEARNKGSICLAWEWLRMETEAALYRRQAREEQFEMLQIFLGRFEFFSVGMGDYPAIRKILMEHRLRAADAGHLLCLKQAQKVHPKIEFVCFDQELVQAAQKENIRIFGRP